MEGREREGGGERRKGEGGERGMGERRVRSGRERGRGRKRESEKKEERGKEGR